MHVVKHEREFQCPIIANAWIKSVFRKQKLDNLTPDTWHLTTWNSWNKTGKIHSYRQLAAQKTIDSDSLTEQSITHRNIMIKPQYQDVLLVSEVKCNQTIRNIKQFPHRHFHDTKLIICFKVFNIKLHCPNKRKDLFSGLTLGSIAPCWRPRVPTPPSRSCKILYIIWHPYHFCPSAAVQSDFQTSHFLLGIQFST